MVINIIDREFNFLGQIDEYESFILSKKWHGIGNFELHLNIKNNHTEYLQKENIIFTDEKKAYVILYREIDSVTNKLVVKGLELKSYLGRWVVFPPTGQANYRVNSNVETIMKEYVQATLERKGITNIIVAENLNRGIQTVYQSRYKNLADELEKLSLASNLSWDIALDLDNKRFIFDVIEGRDITVNQDLLPPAIFSIEYDNIGEQKLVDSKLDYRNTAIVAGQGEGVDRAITVVGEGEGFDSFETFIDARDIENDNDLPERGQQKLTETQEILTFDSQVLTDKNLVYEEDFKLGDKATKQNRQWNITTDRRITEITEIYEATGFKLDVAFGEGLPTIIDLVKKATDTPVAEGGSGSATPTDDDDNSGSPGNNVLIAGTMDQGFFGEVPASELITGDALASMVGISAGTSQFSSEGWLKFAYQEKIQFVAKKPIRHSISWDSINSANCIYGDKTVTIGGLTYKVRLMRGANKDPAVEHEGTINHNSEWNKLMLPIHIEAKNKNWAYESNVEADVPYWGIDFTDADLHTHRDHGSGSYSWCQEVGQSSSYRHYRGHLGVSYSSAYPPSSSFANYGFRPVLELVEGEEN